MRPRQRQHLGAEGRNHLLVGGHDALACLQQGFGEIVGRVRAAHHLRDHRYLRVVQNDLKIVGDQIPEGAVRKVPQIEDVFDPDRFADPRLNECPVMGQHLGCAAADNAEAQKCRVFHR